MKRKIVIQGEDREKISSPHSIEILGAKILHKWEYMIWIGSSYNFSSILVIFGWKNWKNRLASPF